MKKVTSAAQVIRKIGCDKLSLTRGPGGGYWYFSYDDTVAGVWETHSVYVCYLGQLTLDRWVAEGQELINKVKKQEN